MNEKSTSNIWAGANIQNQQQADERIPELLKIPAVIRFLVFEPPLESIYIPQLRHIDWVIVGGESGPNARPLNPEWVRSIRDQCQEADVPFFFKQWGEWTPDPPSQFLGDIIANNLDDMHQFETGKEHTRYLPVYRVGKKAAGNILDGRQWLEMPEDRK